MAFTIFTVSYLPKPIRVKIRKYQKIISKKFNTNKALNWVPHITIANGVSMPESKFHTTCEQIKQICDKTNPIFLSTKKLHFIKIPNSSFENPYAILIEVNLTKKLQELHNIIQNNIYKGFKRPSYKSNKYIPHITLAYRDLTKQNFDKAKKFFKDNPIKINYSFKLDNLQLVPLRNEQRKSIKTFKFL